MANRKQFRIITARSCRVVWATDWREALQKAWGRGRKPPVNAGILTRVESQKACHYIDSQAAAVIAQEARR